MAIAAMAIAATTARSTRRGWRAAAASSHARGDTTLRPAGDRRAHRGQREALEAKLALALVVAEQLEREDPIQRLMATGFDASEPALVIWEGVVPYLTEGAVRATASRLASGLDPRSLVAFDFVGKKLASGEGLTGKALETRDYVGERGEPIRYGTDDVLPLLYECGFRWVRSLDFNELALEMLGDYQRERMFRFQHLALAAVRSPGAGWP
jgi:O-methyltransferase involved in polyketide biosynthesis